MCVKTLQPSHRDYPDNVRRELAAEAPPITTSRPVTWGKRAIASRLASAGIVVASGGALGIDTEAHEGALALGGQTWCIAPTSSDGMWPKENHALFGRIGRTEGSAMIWPFESMREPHQPEFFFRNRVLIALSEAVIVVQAKRRSGSLNSARAAIEMKRQVFVLRAPAWGGEAFDGNREFAGRKEVRVIDDVKQLYVALGVEKAFTPTAAQLALALELDPPAGKLLEAVRQSPQHLDEIAHSSGLPVAEAATLLLTLALENVVVEGPSGFYRRA
jgi:DNA processing protein